MTNEQRLRECTCCFTGHRPEKLGQAEKEIRALLGIEILTAVNDGYVRFISGMARGADIWAAEAVLRLRGIHDVVRLVCASPYEGFEKSWAKKWKERYRRIMAAADEVNFICPAYSNDCFQRRNEWMVDRSARVIAVYNGARGGTRNTIAYARGCGVEVRHIDALSGSGS